MPAPSPAHPAATVLLVREEPRFEVLMVRRHHQVEFASGALVFPGGKVEPGDRDPGWAGHVTGADGLREEERALRICAVREAFEESGVLLVPDGSAEDGRVARRAAEARVEVAGGRVAFRDLVGDLGLRVDLAALVPFAHWITPEPLPKRFDTRFFLMAAPPGLAAAADGHETVDAAWIAPADALRLGESGARTIIFPTRLNLALLARSTSAAEALASAASRTVVTVEPRLEAVEGGFLATIPADAGYGLVPPTRI